MSYPIFDDFLFQKGFFANDQDVPTDLDSDIQYRTEKGLKYGCGIRIVKGISLLQPGMLRIAKRNVARIMPEFNDNGTRVPLKTRYFTILNDSDAMDKLDWYFNDLLGLERRLTGIEQRFVSAYIDIFEKDRKLVRWQLDHCFGK